jgi:polysaccharide export outer membrane protein
MERVKMSKHIKTCAKLALRTATRSLALREVSPIFTSFLEPQRMLRRLSLYLIIAVAGASCVSNKKFVLLQKDDVNKRDLPIDSVVRNYKPVQHEYKIQSEDLLSVRFESLTTKDFDFLNHGNQTLNITGLNALVMGELVDANGAIPFPFLGKVVVAGLTVFEIQDKLQGIANQYVESPVVKVRLINFRFTILGEVNQEGTTVLINNRVNMLEAIGWAGGTTDLADKANVKLIRNINGETTVQYINLLKEDFINSPYYYLHQNDVLVVPALRQRPYRKYVGQNLALLVSTLSLLVLVVTLTK